MSTTSAQVTHFVDGEPAFVVERLSECASCHSTKGPGSHYGKPEESGIACPCGKEWSALSCVQKDTAHYDWYCVIPIKHTLTLAEFQSKGYPPSAPRSVIEPELDFSFKTKKPFTNQSRVLALVSDPTKYFDLEDPGVKVNPQSKKARMWR